MHETMRTTEKKALIVYFRSDQHEALSTEHNMTNLYVLLTVHLGND